MENKLQYKTNDKLLLSASKINLFYDCPRKYFYRYLYIWPDEKIESVSWPGSGFGEAIHKTLEFVSISLMNNEKDVLKTINGKFKEFYDLWLENNKTTFRASRDYVYKKFIEKGEKYALLIGKFFINYFNDYIKILPEEKFEIPFKYSKYEVNLNGIIDLVYFFENGFKIIDFKTTKESNKFYFVDWIIDTQSLIYLYYSLQTYGKIPDSFSYLVLNHEEKTLFFKEQLIDNIDNENKFFKGLTYQVNAVCKYTLNPDMNLNNANAKTCRWCEFSDICELKYKAKISNLLKGFKQ